MLMPTASALRFQHTAARRRLATINAHPAADLTQFQHTAARRRLDFRASIIIVHNLFQHTAARRRLDGVLYDGSELTLGFNTQPPEGGWRADSGGLVFEGLFQHTAARRRLAWYGGGGYAGSGVSTHSRPKAAGASLKSLAPSGFAAPISLSSQEKREREYNTAFSVTPVFAIS